VTVLIVQVMSQKLGLPNSYDIIPSAEKTSQRACQLIKKHAEPSQADSCCNNQLVRYGREIAVRKAAAVQVWSPNTTWPHHPSSPSSPSFLHFSSFLLLIAFPFLSLSHSLSLIMSAPPPHPISPPPGLAGSAEPQSSTVRRHHTITAASRSARTAARAPISEEAHEQQTWVDEEVVDPERVRSVGAVGEKGGSLHRQASLPSRYNRGTSLDVTPS
jgi:hypothetical protein